jgi:putative CocE/NonD family hydrolase
MTEVVIERNLLIPMSDGVRLAADLYRPKRGGPWPALLNYTPYHKDGRGGRTAVDGFNRHMVAKGYACLTLDIRGLGSSEGVAAEPMAAQEAKDGHEAVEWIARQSWCTGKVGMWGVSYPGITSLSTAATQPKSLAAIVPIHATADIRRGFLQIHGCRTGFWCDADWGPRMAGWNLMPPLHQDKEGRWAKIWRERLESNPPWIMDWWEHTSPGKYWASRTADMTKIKAPSFSICGWRDLYAEDTITDYLAIKAPKRLMMGPWKHAFPDLALDNPCAALHEMERWFDRWLKGEKNGVEEEPPVFLHVQGHEAEWRHEDGWPLSRAKATTLKISDKLVLGDAAGKGSTAYASDPTVGAESIAWDPWSSGLAQERPWDQSRDDAQSLAITGERLDGALDILDAATATLDLEATAPATVSVKLADVAPNGRSTLITMGWKEIGAGKSTIEVVLRPTAYRLAPGHRLRLSVALADFPRIWPNEASTITLRHAGTRLVVPTAKPAKARVPKWGPLQPDKMKGPGDLGGWQRWSIDRDLSNDVVTLIGDREESQKLDAETTMINRHVYRVSVQKSRPGLARSIAKQEAIVSRPVGSCVVNTEVIATTHELSIDVKIRLDGELFFARRWAKTRKAKKK